jgi:hypothetical protein
MIAILLCRRAGHYEGRQARNIGNYFTHIARLDLDAKYRLIYNAIGNEIELM